jgi:type IV pilus assembly protein PilE
MATSAMSRAPGFTLIEMLITVVVLAIIVAIAFPSYQRWVLQSHRSAVQTEMMQLAQNFDRCRTRANAYDACGLVETFNETLSETGRYQLRLRAERRDFLIQAVPQAAGNQTKDRCQTLTLNHLGVRDTTAPGLGGEDCW